MCSKKNEEKSYLFLISIAFLSIHGLTRCLFCIWHKWLDFLWNILVCKMLMTLKCERRETFGLNWSGKVVYITEYLFLFQGFLYTSNTSFPATLYLRDFKDIITYRFFLRDVDIVLGTAFQNHVWLMQDDLWPVIFSLSHKFEHL